MGRQWHVVLLVCLLFTSCRLLTSTAQNRNGPWINSAEQSQDVQLEEPLDPVLLNLLHREQQIVRPFAWGGPKERGIIIGIDEHEKLKTVYFEKTDTGWVIRKSGPFRSLESQSARIRKSGSVDLQGYLPDREFPFKADVISMEQCQVHFVLIERSLVRSVRNTVSPLTVIDMRIIVARGSKIVSGENAALSFFGVREAFVTDINGDGKQDYVFIGEDNSKFLYVWTVEPNCAVKPMLFEFEDANRPVIEKFVSGRELFLRPDTSTGGNTIHTRSSEPHIEHGTFYWRISESIYKWERQRSLYKRVKQSTRLEKSE